MHTTPYSPLMLLSVAATLLLVVGCSKPDGPQRYDVSGTVTYKGNPVPSGSIVFTPDSNKGNSGPQGTAKIVDGHYDTAHNGRGTVGGPHQVQVIATEATTAEEAEIMGALAEYTFPLELPEDEFTHDLEIPEGKKQ